MKPSEEEEDKWSPTDCGQNLPAVLNDPKKGKQRDFFTRSWGDSFVDGLPIGSSPYLYELSEHAFDRYIRRIRKHSRPPIQPIALVNRPSKKVIPSISDVPKFFLEENFDLMKPEAFAYIFPFLLKGKGGGSISSQSREEVQESISHHLDLVEINLGYHLAQKYHHFFQVMAYQDALMSQLKALIRVVRELRGDLMALSAPMNQSLKISQLLRRKTNLERLKARLSSLSFLQQSQSTLQLLLESSEFSGALDLIKSSRMLLREDLKGLKSVKALPPRLEDSESRIGKILVLDLQTIIREEIERHTFLARASELLHEPGRGGEDFNEGRLYSVIQGLICLNSFTFLSELEEACGNAVRNIVDKCVSVLPHSKEEDSSVTFRVGEFAKIATPEGWTDLFDMLLGSLIVLLRRVKLVQELILSVIQKFNLADEPLPMKHPPKMQQQHSSAAAASTSKHTIKNSSYQVLQNVCDLINEQVSSLLGLRSKSEAVILMTLSELKSIERLIVILNEEIKSLDFGSQGNCLVLTLQTQILQFIQCFDDKVRSRISEILNSEKLEPHEVKLSELTHKCARFPKLTVNLREAPSGHCIAYKDSPDLSYNILRCVVEFLYMLTEYLCLAAELPGIKKELGFKVATIFAHFNSVVCQYVMGLAVVKIQRLDIVNVSHLILTHNSIDFVARLIPIVAAEFLEPGDKTTTRRDGLNNRFTTSMSRYSDHKEGIILKVQETLETNIINEFNQWPWTPKTSVPSGNFKSICSSIHIFHNMASSLLPASALHQILRGSHRTFIQYVTKEVEKRNVKPPRSYRVARDLLLEMNYYGQSLQRITNCIPPEEANSLYFEKELWKK